MFLSKHRYLAVLAIALLLCGCDKIFSKKPAKTTKVDGHSSVPMVEGIIVAKVGAHVITLDDLNEEIESYNAMVPEGKPDARISTRQKKIDYLKEQLVRKALLYQEGLAQGLDKKRDIMRALEKTKQELLAIELVRQETENTDVSFAEIENYYNTYKEELREPEERKIRALGVLSEQEARETLIQLLQGADFEALARERSKLKSASAGGDLGFIAKGKIPQIDTAAFSDTLEVGKISNIIKASDGYYYILKLEAKQGGKVKSLNEMEDDIKRLLTYLKQEQKIIDLVEKLKSKAGIEIIEGEIK